MSCLVQGTSEWLELRKKHVTASDASVVMGVNPWTSLQRLWEEKMGMHPPKKKTAKMQRGLDFEDSARQYFTYSTGINVEPAVIFHKDHKGIMASLDGISSNGHEIVEIKCPDPLGSSHQDAINGVVPFIYYPQVQHQIAVANTDTAYYLSFDGDIFHGYILEVFRNDIYIEEMIQRELEFYECIVNKRPPKEIKKSSKLMTVCYP